MDAGRITDIQQQNNGQPSDVFFRDLCCNATGLPCCQFTDRRPLSPIENPPPPTQPPTTPAPENEPSPQPPQPIIIINIFSKYYSLKFQFSELKASPTKPIIRYLVCKMINKLS